MVYIKQNFLGQKRFQWHQHTLLQLNAYLKETITSSFTNIHELLNSTRCPVEPISALGSSLLSG